MNASTFNFLALRTKVVQLLWFPPVPKNWKSQNFCEGSSLIEHSFEFAVRSETVCFCTEKIRAKSRVWDSISSFRVIFFKFLLNLVDLVSYFIYLYFLVPAMPMAWEEVAWVRTRATVLLRLEHHIFGGIFSMQKTHWMRINCNMVERINGMKFGPLEIFRNMSAIRWWRESR